MKRCIRSAQQTEIDISELINHISRIYVTSDDASVVYGSYDYDPDEDEDDTYYLTWTDEQLQSLSEDEVHQFTNLELLSRIRKIDNNKLSAEQQEAVKSAFKVKYKMGEQQKQNILDMLADCSDITINKQRYKNLNFLKQHKLTDEDVHYILTQLTPDDFNCKTRSIDADYSGNLLIIMKPKDVKLADGTLISKAQIYIKIDVSVEDEPFAIISFHD